MGNVQPELEKAEEVLHYTCHDAYARCQKRAEKFGFYPSLRNEFNRFSSREESEYIQSSLFREKGRNNRVEIPKQPKLGVQKQKIRNACT